ncbi:hypothetical protein HYW17_02135 [Candidatus Uhrbacteria bacterium]|nr:hypothetical protein [Candidatus Uhrbacteria bacterium]
MHTNETLRGRLRTPKEVELEKELNLPIGSEVSINIISTAPSTSAAFIRFKRAVGSWKDIPEDFIKRVYADRHFSTRREPQ